MARTDSPEGLGGQLRRVDPDRWLTSRFVADREARSDLAALYLYDHELGRARRAASTPLLAEIRLAWWREVLDAIFAQGAVRRHPTALAVAAAVRRRGLLRAPLEAMIDGHVAALEVERLAEDAALAWADAVQGSVARLAAAILDPAAADEAVTAAGRAFGLALLVRTGRIERPAATPALNAALAETRRAARLLSPRAFPAVLPARLARFEAAGRAPGPLRKRLALIAAVATGRV